MSAVSWARPVGATQSYGVLWSNEFWSWRDLAQVSLPDCLDIETLSEAKANFMSHVLIRRAPAPQLGYVVSHQAFCISFAYVLCNRCEMSRESEGNQRVKQDSSEVRAFLQSVCGHVCVC